MDPWVPCYGVFFLNFSSPYSVCYSLSMVLAAVCARALRMQGRSLLEQQPSRKGPRSLRDDWRQIHKREGLERADSGQLSLLFSQPLEPGGDLFPGSSPAG